MAGCFEADHRDAFRIDRGLIEHWATSSGALKVTIINCNELDR